MTTPNSDYLREANLSLEAHVASDVNVSDTSLHHSLGYGSSQSAPGPAVDSRLKKLEATAKTYPTAWTALTLGANVAQYGAPFYPASYRLLSADELELRGLINITSNLAAGATLATLPVGARPQSQVILSCMVANVPQRVDIATNGNISATPALSSGSYVTFDTQHVYIGAN